MRRGSTLHEMPKQRCIDLAGIAIAMRVSGREDGRCRLDSLPVRVACLYRSPPRPHSRPRLQYHLHTTCPCVHHRTFTGAWLPLDDASLLGCAPPMSQACAPQGKPPLPPASHSKSICLRGAHRWRGRWGRPSCCCSPAGCRDAPCVESATKFDEVARLLG